MIFPLDFSTAVVKLSHLEFLKERCLERCVCFQRNEQNPEKDLKIEENVQRCPDGIPSTKRLLKKKCSKGHTLICV